MPSSPNDASPDDKREPERDGASAAFYVFLGTLALSLLTLLGALIFM